jgi:hypothetical protein
VNLADSIRLTNRMYLHTMVSISVWTIMNGKAHESTIPVSLILLRRKCFVFLSWIMKNYPHRQLSPCPQLWFNGRGRLFEAVYLPNGASSGETITNPMPASDDTQLHALGMQCVTLLEPHDPLEAGWARSNRILETDNSLYTMWKGLRDRDWAWRE